MQKIITHFWYDKEAMEAAQLYVSLFDNSKIIGSAKIYDTPSGTSETVTVELAGQKFMMISAGPFFKFNPSISIRVDCDTIGEVVRLWGILSKGGNVMMPLDSYPFSEKYGWVEDIFGLSWQLMHVSNRVITQKLVPTLMFTQERTGFAEEAICFYASIFKNTSISDIVYYDENESPDPKARVKYSSFILEGQNFSAMDSGFEHDFTFNEAVSLIVNCENQQEIDYFWEKLSFYPESEQCGWCKDKYGVSWQIVPTAMEEMMKTKDPEKLRRVTEAFLKMKKFDIAELTKAFDGR